MEKKKGEQKNQLLDDFCDEIFKFITTDNKSRKLMTTD
jgi:hypothetical protein